MIAQLDPADEEAEFLDFSEVKRKANVRLVKIIMEAGIRSIYRLHEENLKNK